MAEIIDADGHVTEPPVVWQEYTEPRFRDLVLRVAPDESGIDRLWVEGKPRIHEGRSFAAGCLPGGMQDPERARRLGWADLLPGGYDPHARLAVLDQENIPFAVLYPTVWLLIGDIQNPEVAAAACRAYNNWISDFCSFSDRSPRPPLRCRGSAGGVEPASAAMSNASAVGAPPAASASARGDSSSGAGEQGSAAWPRLYGVAAVPMQDPEAAAAETRRAVERLGLRAVFIRPEPYGGRRLNDPAYDCFWAEAQALDIPVAIHASFGTEMPNLARARYRDPFFLHMTAHPFEQLSAALDVICGGVLERFPRLTVAFMESGVGWVGYWLDRMDSHFESMRRYVPWLKMRPSEYFRRQCFVSLDPEETTIRLIADLGLERCVIWGSDYPHFDCIYPGVLSRVKAALEVLPPSAQNLILGENARRLYRLFPNT